MIECCATCLWHDGFSCVCYQGYSPRVAEVTDDNEVCDWWEESDYASEYAETGVRIDFYELSEEICE